MSRKPKRYEPQPSSPAEYKPPSPAEILSGRRHVNPGAPSWVTDILLGIILKEYPEAKRERLLPRLQYTLENAPLLLEELNRLDSTILPSIGGKEKILERFIRDISKKRQECSGRTLKLHAAWLQNELGVFKGLTSCKAWLSKNLQRVLITLGKIPCGCTQRTILPTDKKQTQFLDPSDRYYGPTSTSLLYAILGYHHGNREPNTIQKRLIGQNARRSRFIY